MDKIPITVLVVTKNEEAVIARCLNSLIDFDEVIVVDSYSTDRTREIVESLSVPVVDFLWDGQYPKKRQWCLDHLPLKHEWVFWVDADEVVMPLLINEIRRIFIQPVKASGFFVKGQYVFNGQALQYGLKNNKIALFNRYDMEFPIVDDLDCVGMGEIEGHYQPVLKSSGRVSQLCATLSHYANEDAAAWSRRHECYARWEVCMTRKGSWPEDPVIWREFLKRIMRRSPLKPYVMFLHSYILKQGFLDGKQGYSFAMQRKAYYDMVLRLSKE